MIFRIKCIALVDTVNMSCAEGESEIRTNRGREAWCYGSNPHKSSNLNEIYSIMNNCWGGVVGQYYYVVEEFIEAKEHP